MLSMIAIVAHLTGLHLEEVRRVARNSGLGIVNIGGYRKRELIGTVATQLDGKVTSEALTRWAAAPKKRGQADA